MAELEDVAGDVAQSLQQLRDGAPPPDAMPRQDYTQPAATDYADHESALDDAARLAKRATDLIERGERGSNKEQDHAEAPQQEPQTRDARGRFGRRAAKPEQPATAADPETRRVADRVDELLSRGQSKLDANGLPAVLSKKEKAALEQLSPEIRQAVTDMIVRRETETENGIQKLRERFGEGAAEIDKLLAPRRERLRQLGFDRDDKAISHLLSWSDSIERDPAGAIQHYINHMRTQGLDLVPVLASRLGFGQQGQQQPQMTEQQMHEYVSMSRAHEDIAAATQSGHIPGINDPNIRQTMSRILTSGQARGSRGDELLSSAHDQAVFDLVQQGHRLPDEIVGPAVARNEVRQFENDAANEFLPILRPTMRKLLETGQAFDLRTAYDKAMAQHSRLRMFSAHQVELDKKRRASSASLTTMGTPSGSPRSSRSGKATHFDEVADSVRQALDQHR